LTQNTVVVDWADATAISGGVSKEGFRAGKLANASAVILLGSISTARWAGSFSLGDLLDEVGHKANRFASNWVVDLEITFERSGEDLSPKNSVGSLHEGRRSKEDSRKSEGFDANRIGIVEVPNNLLSQVDGWSLQDGFERGILEGELALVVDVDDDHLNGQVVESTENDRGGGGEVISLNIEDVEEVVGLALRSVEVESFLVLVLFFLVQVGFTVTALL